MNNPPLPGIDVGAPRLAGETKPSSGGMEIVAGGTDN